jgi:hypothetical protein
MMSYATVPNCPLVYPETEIDCEGEVIVKASPIPIAINRVNLRSENCCQQMESTARQVLTVSPVDLAHGKIVGEE